MCINQSLSPTQPLATLCKVIPYIIFLEIYKLTFAKKGKKKRLSIHSCFNSSLTVSPVLYSSELTLTVWITINLENSERDRNTRPPDLPLEKICMQITKQQLELDMEQQTGSK